MVLVFGLSGNPPHRGHLDVIKQGIEKQHGKVNQILIVPCRNHPFGKVLNDFDIITTLNTAFAKDVTSVTGIQAEMMDIEGTIMREQGVTTVYSADIIKWLKSKGHESLMMCYGPDNKEKFNQFKYKDYLLRNCSVFFAQNRLDVRSTAIRKAANRNDDVLEFLTPQVATAMTQFDSTTIFAGM